MSIYSNPATGAAEDAERYVAAVIALLGDADPMTVLRSSVSWFTENTRGLSRSALSTPERPGKWSIAAVLQHVADSELVWGYRLRKVLSEDRPTLTGFDQDRWSDRLRYAEADRDHTLAVFDVLRAANLRLLDNASASDLSRFGVHAERGEESVSRMVRLYAGHDLVHRRQVERIRVVSTTVGKDET